MIKKRINLPSHPKMVIKKYTSIAAAKAAGSLYYEKNGKKMAAVFAEDLKGLTGSPQEKLRKYLNARTKKMSMGGSLKAVPSANTGLKKLPTPVRNKMGYMNKGGTPKKANKGMLIITIGSAKKMKKKKESLMVLRNYGKEYKNFQKKEEEKKKRASRNAARRLLMKKGLVKKGDKKDVAHKNGNP